MSDKKGVKAIATKHIDAGIKKYEGKLNTQLNLLIKNAGLNYTAYVFNDGRILLVLPNNLGAFLYANEETLFESLELSS